MNRPTASPAQAYDAGRAGSAWSRVTGSPWFAPALLATILLRELFTLILDAKKRLFWFDELVTYRVSGLQPWARLWSALEAGADGMPPGYYMMVRLARMLPVDPHIALRLPSILGYLLTLVGVYLFVRKRFTAMAGLAAALLIALSPFRQFAIEARAYAPEVGYLAVSMALWQRIGQRRIVAPLFAVSLALAVACHHLAIIATGPFLAAEFAATRTLRRIRGSVWAAFLPALAVFLAGVPLLLRFRAVAGGKFWAHPGWGSAVIGTYQGAFLGLDSALALTIALFFAAVLYNQALYNRIMRRGEADARPDEFTLPETMLAGGFLFFPVVLVTITSVLHGGYTARYGWPVVLGLAPVAVYLIRGLWRTPAAVSLVFALVIVLGLQDQGAVGQAVEGTARVDGRWTTLAKISHEHPDLPVVIADGMVYLEAAEYAPPELRGRLVQVADRDLAGQLAGTDSVDAENLILARYFPLRVESPAVFEAGQGEFVLLSTEVYQFEWLTRYFTGRGYRLKLLSKEGAGSIYLADRPAAGSARNP